MNKLIYLLLSLMIISNSAKTSNFIAEKNYIISLMGLGVAAAIYYCWSCDHNEKVDEHYKDQKLEQITNKKQSSIEFNKDAVVECFPMHAGSEEHGEADLQAALVEIKDHRFDVKKYFSIIYELILAQKASQSKRIKVLSALYNEQNLKDALNQKYANYDYLLLFYAHAPHSSYENKIYPKEPLAHTSLLLCEIDENSTIKKVLNIDGFDRPHYVNPGSNPLIHKRLVLKDGGPLQRPTSSNMNCVLYAFTFAERILKLIELQDINEPNRHALTADFSKFENNLFSGIIGIYVPKTYEENLAPEEKQKIKDDMALNHHNRLREKIAQAYLQSVGKIDKALNYQ